METVSLGSGNKRELDDSGCVQDECPPAKKANEEYTGSAQLLDLSDDVLLFIFKHCSPMDLKALGYSCPRLGTLIRDRTLWQRVDARDSQTGRTRLRWLLAHGVGEHTTELQLRGYAKEAGSCMGHVHRERKHGDKTSQEEYMEMLAQIEARDRMRMMQIRNDMRNGPQLPGGSRTEPEVRISEMDPCILRFNSKPVWYDDPEHPQIDTDPAPDSERSKCPGPQFTLTQCMLKQIRTKCVNMSALALEYCNIDCATTGINQLPSTLKRLSLRGTKCYNLPVDKSFLFKIQDYMPDLEELNLSECDWLEPASLLPLSKMAKLQRLYMRECNRLSEFVAYASLATRYGFRQVKVLDLRGSPVGDSEVSALGWLPLLEELYLSPARDPRPRPDRQHSHYKDEALPVYSELEDWEKQVPEYLKIKQSYISIDRPADSSDVEQQIQQIRSQEANMCLHGRDYNLCTEGIRPNYIKCFYKYDQPYTGRRNEKCTQVDTPRVRQTNQITQTVSITPTNYRDEREKTRKCTIITPRLFNRSNLVNISCQTENSNNNHASNNNATSSNNNKVLGDKNVVIGKISGGITVSIRNTKASVGVKMSSDDTEGDNTKNVGDNDAKKAGDSKTHNNIKITVYNHTTNVVTENDVKDNLDNASSSKDSGISTGDSSNDAQISPRIDNDNETPGCSKDVKESKDKVDKGNGSSNKDLNDKDKSDSHKRKPDDDDDSDEDDDDSNRVKRRRIIVVNQGASTSKSVENNEGKNEGNNKNDKNEGNNKNEGKNDKNEGNDKNEKPKFEQFIRFRQNEAPVIVHMPVAENLSSANVTVSPINVRPIIENAERPVMGRQHVLYVNVGQQIQTMYRMVENERTSRNFTSIFGPPLDATSFVTDSAIRRFGRSDSDDCVQIGHCPVNDSNARPNRSNLRILHVTGYRNITDRSLLHLISAAPHLQEINFSNTRVTAQGVENFRASRPDCEVIFSPYVEKRSPKQNEKNGD